MRKGKKQTIKLPPTTSGIKPAAPAGEVFDFAPSRPKPAQEVAAPVATPQTSLWEREWLYAGVSALAAVAVYLNTLRGEFVYDDKRQIVRNALIQDLSYFWRALTSDVWAFKTGVEGVAASNYWRPSFVFWMIANFQLFGLSPAGWHVTNILGHAGVTVLAYFLLRRLDLSRWAAGAVALTFAVHPVHTESVAWIAGAPDIIMSLGVLGSLWFVKNLETQPTARNWLLALALCAVALGAKEAAILYPLVVFAWRWQPGTDWRPAARMATPFAALASVYFLIRFAIIGTLTQKPPDAPGFGEMLLSVPAIFCFYLRQMVFPYWIGPSYPLRPVAALGAANFFVPLVIAVLAGAALLWRARRGALARLGLAMFLFFLAPAFNVAAFPREQAVHDRYLYLSLLGFLLLVVPPLWEWAETRLKVVALVVLALICCGLGVQTVRYNRAWLNGVALFQWGIKSDPSAVINHDSLAAEYTGQQRWNEALASYNQALTLGQQSNSYVGRAQVLTELQRYDEAERDLREVIVKRANDTNQYTLYQAYERLAICYERQKKFDQAVQILTEGRGKLPIYYAALTEKMSVVLYQAGKQDVALAQLETARPYARQEILPESRLVLFRLGLLYSGFNKPKEARGALLEYIRLTNEMQDPITQQYRQQAAAALQKLGGQ